MKSNRIVQLDENGEFKKTFFYKNDDKRISPIANHPGLSALQQTIDRSLACNAATQANIDKCKAMLR